MSKPVKLLIYGLGAIFIWRLGFAMGEKQLSLQFINWKPAVIVNKEAGVGSKAAEADFAMLWTVWDRVSQLYVDKTALDSKKMVDGAIAGMVAAIGDPYTMYLPARENQQSKEDLGGAFGGVGIELGYKEKQLAVIAPMAGSPAEKAGIKGGDLILKIEDPQKKITKTTENMTTQEAVTYIRGEKGSRVVLTLFREGADKPFTADLVRDTIVVKSVTVEAKQINNKKLAWVKLTRFGDRTAEEWNAVVSDIIAAGPKYDGLVLDLRNNPGGYLEMAVNIAGEFLPEGKNVVTQRTGDGLETENKVSRNGRLLKMPLTVLVNKGSASASEILAGALQDYKRAKVVGEQSFGKGSVQQPEDFADKSGIHVTIARWLRPSGEWIDKKGITPDIKVEIPENNPDNKDPQLEKALETLSK